ncbi:hypothetical protein BaRGS_00022619, partial [Batillaria attramentaria]
WKLVKEEERGEYAMRIFPVSYVTGTFSLTATAMNLNLNTAHFKQATGWINVYCTLSVSGEQADVVGADLPRPFQGGYKLDERVLHVQGNRLMWLVVSCHLNTTHFKEATSSMDEYDTCGVSGEQTDV